MKSSRHHVSLLLGVSALLLLPACSSPTTASTPTPTPSATTAPPAADAPVSYDAADPSTWLITETGIGRAEIGQTLEAADDALMPTFGQADACEALSYREPSQTSLDFGVVEHNRDGLLNAIAVSVPYDMPVTGSVEGSPLTETGVGLGATTEELLSAEPTAVVQTDSETPSYVVTFDSSFMIFEAREPDNRIGVITVSETLPPVGFCG